jgi:hypothetical protein
MSVVMIIAPCLIDACWAAFLRKSMNNVSFQVTALASRAKAIKQNKKRTL